MSRKERFYATIERKPVDRPASWLGLPVEEALPALVWPCDLEAIKKSNITVAPSILKAALFSVILNMSL